jgi:outer membrane biosynthesis protein TonB
VATTAPAASPSPAPSPAPSTENLLVRFGLLTTEQVEEALQEQRGNGKHVAQIAVERGWVTREQLTQLLTRTPPPPAAEVVPEPAQAPPPPPAEVVPEPAAPAPPASPAAEVVPEPAAAPAPDPTPAAAPTPAIAPAPTPEPVQPEPELPMVARVWARLSTGERVEVASFADLREARARAQGLVRELSAERPEWPCFSGRFVRPEAIVSLDVEATLA